MILLTLTSGSITKRLCNKTEKSKGGYDNGSYFFAPEITSFSDVDFEGLPFVSVRAGNITCEYKEVASLTAEEVTATLQIWDEYTETSPITVFEGKALRTDIVIEEDEKFRESVFVTYRLRTDMDELETDLLSSAYDLKQVNTDATTYNDGRILPMNFGYVKYAAGFLLAVTCSTGCGGVYSSDGKTVKAYDGGLEGNYTQGASSSEVVYNPTTGRAPVYGLSQDIIAGDATSASVTTKGDIAIGTPISSYNGDENDATVLSLEGANITDQTGVSSATRLDFKIEADGQKRVYVWDTSANIWRLAMEIGASTSGTDYNFIYIDGTLSAATYDFFGIIAKTQNKDALEGYSTNNRGVFGQGGVYGIYGTTTAGYGGGFAGSAYGGKGDIRLTGATSDPSSPDGGAMYYNTATGKFRGYNAIAGAWENLN